MGKINFKRFWVYFRAGHGQYLIYMMSMTSFLLIVYRLLIEQIQFFESIFSSLWIFVIVFVPLYIPVAVLVGRLHYRRQLETDFVEANKHNPQMIQILNDLNLIKKTLKINDVKKD